VQALDARRSGPLALTAADAVYQAGAMGVGTELGMRVGDMDLERLIVLPPDTRLLEAAQSMVRTGVSAVAIGAGATILTERDVVIAMSRGRSPLTPALLAVSTGGEMVAPSATAADSLAAMIRSDVTQLVVVDETGEPIGTVSLSEVLTAVVGDGGVSQWISAVTSSRRSAIDELETQG
jgi:CBS domain-containing protein